MDHIYRLPPKQTEILLQEIYGKLTDLDTDINTDFEENSPYEGCVVSETCQRPDRSYFQKPPELENLVSTGKLVQKFLTKQTDTDKILKIIQSKVLKGAYLPVTTGRLLNQPLL